jgi:membrane protease YdiL (CAAX protease family)
LHSIDTIGEFGILHLIFFGLWMPWAAIRSGKKLSQLKTYPPRRQHFSSALILQLAFLGISVVVARREWIDVFAPYTPSLKDVGLGLLVLATFVFAMARRWKYNVDRRLPKVELFSPRNALERILWIGISLAAGIGEEITYRGVMYILLLRWTGVSDLAALISAVVFAVSHMVQGWRSALVIFLFALVFQGLVLSTGTLYVAMAVHCVYDITAGMVYGTLSKRRDAADAALESTRATAG